MAEEQEDFIRLSERMGRLPPYLFGRINALKDRMRREGADVIDMAMGNPTDPTPQPIVDKLCEVVRDSRNHRYSAAAGIYNLRREVAKHYDREYGVGLDPEKQVICTIGSKEGFSHLCLALISPGDTAMVPTPSYPIHSYGVVLAGGSYLGIPVNDDEEFLRRVDDTCTTHFPKPKVLFLNYPHNPTAHTVEADFFVEVVKLAKKHRIIVIHDFAYGQICFDGFKAPSFLATPGAMDVGAEFTTMSKGYNMAGWRIGYCAGNEKVVGGLARVKGYYDYGVFQAIQIASIVALREGAEEVKAQALEYQGRRDALLEGLERVGWTGIARPRGAMFIWAPIPEEFRAMGSMAFAAQLMEDAEVAVSPGLGFGPDGEGFVRLALIENRQRILQAVRNIKRAFTKWREQGVPPAK